MEKMNEQDIKYFTLESSNERWSRIVRMMMILWAVTIVVAIVAVAAVDYGWRQFISESEIESCTVSTGGAGNANYIGNDGDIYNGGESNSKKDKAEEQNSET